MAQRTDLIDQESNCSSCGDFLELATLAHADPADEDYTRELLDKAELQCQDPQEYVQLASFYAKQLNELDTATDLLEQAEDACFEALEYAQVGHGYSHVLNDSEKSAALIQQAMEEASSDEEKEQITALGSEEPQSEQKVELTAETAQDFTELHQFRELAEKLHQAGDPDEAKVALKQAERHLNSIAEIVEYSSVFKELLNDEAEATSILDNAEMDCQFPGDYIELARGFKQILNAEDRLDELLAEAADIVMEGSEHLEVARGFWELKQDRETASHHYQQALQEITDREILLEVASLLATQLNNRELAKDYFQAVQNKATSAGDLAKLAVTVTEVLEDSDYAAEIFSAAEQKMSNASELVNLAETVAKILDTSTATESIYRKAVDLTDNFQMLERILNSQKNTLNNQAFTHEILDKMLALSATTSELLSLCNHARLEEGLEQFTQSALEAAEDQATSTSELESVEKLVAELDPENIARIENLCDKIQRRKANESKYAILQQKESQASTPLENMRLAKEIALVVEDLQYARKLIDKSVEQLVQEVFDTSQWLTLIEIAANNLKDPELTETLVSSALFKCEHFSGAYQLALSVSGLPENKTGNKLATKILQQWESRLDSTPDKIKFANAVHHALGDKSWVQKILSNFNSSNCTRLQSIELGVLFTQVGDDSLAIKWFENAAEKCTTPNECAQMIRRMQSGGVDLSIQKKIYQRSQQAMQRETDLLHWVEGILTYFRDIEWAKSAYDEIENSISDDAVRSTLKISRKHRLEKAL